MALAGKTPTRANWALIPNSPLNELGMRTEPPPSVPSANGVIPAATLVAAPQLDPPGVLARFQALGVTPVSGLSPTALQPNSLVVDLPTMQPPCRRTRSTEGASTAALLSAMALEPKVSLKPSTAIRSFTEIGRPWSSPSASPDITARSAFLAASRATSGEGSTKQLSVDSSPSIRSRDDSTSSTGEISFLAIPSLNSIAVIKAKSLIVPVLPRGSPLRSSPCRGRTPACPMSTGRSGGAFGYRRPSAPGRSGRAASAPCLRASSLRMSAG